jgi:DNA-binding response OmpR family regulator
MSRAQDREIARLRSALYQRDARILELEALLAREGGYPAAFGLTHMQTRMLDFLMRKAGVKRRAMHAFLYGATAQNAPSEKTVSVQIYLMRRKLAPHGITIERSGGSGWSLPAPAKARLREAIDRELSACALARSGEASQDEGGAFEPSSTGANQ